MSEKRNENIRRKKRKEMGKIRNRHPEDLQRSYSSKKNGDHNKYLPVGDYHPYILGWKGAR